MREEQGMIQRVVCRRIYFRPSRQRRTERLSHPATPAMQTGARSPQRADDSNALQSCGCLMQIHGVATITMRKFYAFQDQQLVETQDVNAVIQIVVSPDDAERRLLIETFNVDEHTLSSATDPDELARLEFEPEHIAIIAKRPRNYSGGTQLLFKVDSTGIFLFKERLVIVLNEDIPLFDKKHFRRVTRLQDVMLKVVYRSILHFLEHLKVINMITDEVETKINTAMENRHLINMFELEKSMTYYLNAIHSNALLIDKIKSTATRLGLTEDEIEVVDDMIVDNSQCFKQAEIYSNILASMMDARASIVSNNLNVHMKTLTIITLGIMLPTFIVSAFSMNVKYPFNTQELTPFFLILLLALTTVAAFIYFIRKKKW